MKNNSLFIRLIATSLCAVFVVGSLLMCYIGGLSYEYNFDFDETPIIVPSINAGGSTTTTTTTKPTTSTSGKVPGSSTGKNPNKDNNAIFSASTTLEDVELIHNTLTNHVTIGSADSYNAILPADVKIAAGASGLELSVKPVETGDEINLANSDSAKSLDVHIEGIAADNTVPMIVNLGAVLEAGLGETELKFYHTENGTAVLMTRVASLNDFAIHNQYTYNAETGEVSIYVASFSVISAVRTTPDVWNGVSVAEDFEAGEGTADDPFIIKTAAQLIYFRNQVDAGNKFEGQYVALAADIDLDKHLFNPIGGGWAYNGGKTFNGTFDGGNHTIYNLYVNGWELDATGDKHSGTSKGAGLFSSIHNATIKNLAVVGSELVVETTSIGIIAGVAQGKCTFENIVVSDATLGNYQMRNGGIVGDIYVIASDNVPEGEDKYSHIFKNIIVDSTVKLSSMWGDFDTGNGGVVGGKYGSAKVLMENVTVAAELDVFSDVTSAYQWYAYRRCGMLIGYTGQNSPKQATNAAADFLTCKNVNVYYGDWTNYTYYQFTNQDISWQSNYPWVRAEESPYNGAFSNVRYGNPIVGGEKINTIELAEANQTGKVTITFNQLYGGGQGVYGTNKHEGNGVEIQYSLTKTIYYQDVDMLETPTLHYWFVNGKDTWTTLVDGVSIELAGKNGEYNVYKIVLPAHAHRFNLVDENGKKSAEINIDDLDHDYKLYSITNEGKLNYCNYNDKEESKTIYFQNNWLWNNLVIEYWYENDKSEKWTTVGDGKIDLSSVTSDGTYSVYEIQLPASAHAVKISGYDTGAAKNNEIELDISKAVDDNVYLLKWDGTKNIFDTCHYVPGVTTFYFQNNWLWTDVKLNYMCNNISLKNPTKEGTFEIYTVTVPNFATQFTIDGKKNDNSGNRDITPSMTTEKIVPEVIYSMNYNNNNGNKLVESVKISLVPNTSWKSNNAWFAAYVWVDEKNNAWIKMNDTDGDGTYECYIPKEYTNVIFCRMKEKTTTFDWNSTVLGKTYDIKISDVSKDGFVINTLYMKPNSNWTQSSARFAAYFFGNGETWIDMNDLDKDGVYECVVPAGYTKVIFCRMNPNASANNWDNKWNQTGDLTIPTNGNNLFTVPNGAWDGSTATWSKKQ